MGLDNMPLDDPCMYEYDLNVDDVDGGCDALQKCDKCPWIRDMGKEPGAAYGMFGRPCWYRGKMGNYLLRMLIDSGESPPTDFYGEGIDTNTEGISSRDCIILADWMEERVDVFTKVIAIEEPDADPQDSDNMYAYAIKWLRFVSKYGGSAIWY
jgi:hypothetical protein